MVLLVNMHLITNINNSLSWTKQAVEVEKKNPRRQIQRNLFSCSAVVKERAYLSLGRPICEYGSVAWSPSHKRT